MAAAPRTLRARGAQDPAYRPAPPRPFGARHAFGMTRPSGRPTRADLEAARDRTVPDVVGPRLRAIFCGINPGLYSAAVGHHFARPGNRFWKALQASGFTARLLVPDEERELLRDGLGITNLVERATAVASELTDEELRAGARSFERKVRRLRPRAVAVLGVTAYRAAFDHPKAELGPQPEPLAGAPVWVLPNPSGLNAHHQLDDLARRFAELRRSVDERGSGRARRR
jgi:double-stranded uracil-DNA glycosylase